MTYLNSQLATICGATLGSLLCSFVALCAALAPIA